MKKRSRKLFVFLTVFTMLFNNIAMASYAEESIETVTEQVTEAVTEELDTRSASTEDADEILSEPIVTETQNEENAAEEEVAVQNAEEQVEILSIDVVELASNDGESTTTMLESGEYAVDVSWSPMSSLAPMLRIDAANMTFNVYGAADPSTSKGSGSITCAEGVYTLTYENENTTTFTYENGVITFTSRLWYGAASFNNVDDSGKFVTYTASKKSSAGNTEGTDSDYKDGDVISVTDLSKLKAGNYTLTASLSCYVSAMGGVEFGTGILEGAILTVDADGKAKITLDLGTSSVNIYGITANTFISSTEGETGYYDGEAWKDVTYTIDANKYIDKLTFPIQKVSDTYELALYLDSDVMGKQFGGTSSNYKATLTIDWTKVTVGGGFSEDNSGSGDTDGDKDQDADKDTTEIASGKHGSNLTWVLDSKGVLTISGKGTMADSSYNAQPWASYISQIKSVVIGDEVTSVGSRVFMSATNLSSVTIGNSVTSIGDYAFNGCTSLKEIEFPKSLTKIGQFAFNGCTGLEKITFNGSAPQVGSTPLGTASATCYYPAGDDTWSSVITGKSFGNNLTWIAVETTPDYEDGEVISVADLSKLPAGNYTLAASLSCYVSAMGGVEFGAPLLEKAILTIAEDESASITLDMGTSSVNIYGITANTYISADGVTGYQDGTEWKTAAYTKNVHDYVDKITFPITKANATYALAMKVGSDVMGTQFGGESGKYAATLTIDWTKTAVGGKLAEETHSWDNGTVTEAATCTETGVMTYKCSCGVTKTETIAAAGHTEGDWKVTKGATCTEAGTKVQTCTKCGDTINTATIKAKGHSYGTWTTVSEATVLAAKTQKHTCTSCNASETQSVGSKLTPVLEVAGKLSSISMKKGNSKSFTVTMEKGDSVKSVTSSAVKIVKASLDSKTGKITLKALKKGSAKVTISLISGKSRTYTVKVTTGTVKTTGISAVSVTNNKLTLKAGKTHTLKTELKPFTSTQKVTYSSSNKKVATVTSAGKIKAVAAGKATITAKSGSKSVKVTVTVPGIGISKTSVSVKKGKTLNLAAKTYGISEKVTYTSSNTKTATVTASGKIKGIKKGTAKITIKAGSYTKTVTVKVK